ncbi:hypothetical protein [Demequina salsinemoris]|uniref:hypothetical protein n=1 Tax=Demequina salsinemoris TaxID=577470 RepID=UPI001F218192|nr:hypothetical protein [Demequina salsinemoris]
MQLLTDDTGPDCAALLADAPMFCSNQGIRVREDKTDNAKNDVRAQAFGETLTRIEAKYRGTRPCPPWQNGKTDRVDGTLQERWVDRGPTPISRVTPTC